MKPGEKLTEVLVDDATEALQPTRLHKIRTISAQPFDTVEFARKLHTLETAASRSSPEDVYKILASLGIGFLYNPSNQLWPGTVVRAVSPLGLDLEGADPSLAKLEITNPRYS